VTAATMMSNTMRDSEFMTTAFWREQSKHGFEFACGTCAERGASKGPSERSFIQRSIIDQGFKRWAVLGSNQ
jgi:hypothetical protein